MQKRISVYLEAIKTDNPKLINNAVKKVVDEFSF